MSSDSCVYLDDLERRHQGTELAARAAVHAQELDSLEGVSPRDLLSRVQDDSLRDILQHVKGCDVCAEVLSMKLEGIRGFTN